MKKINKLIKSKINEVSDLVENSIFDNDLKLKFTVKKIAFKIFFTLKTQNKTQNDLAKILGVTPQNVSKLLKGEDYKISTLIKIEEALKINLIDRNIFNSQHNISIIFHVKSFENQRKPLLVDKNFMFLNHTFDLSEKIVEKDIFHKSLSYNNS